MIDQGVVIAEGTSDELKARVGGERLEVTLEDPAQASEAVLALSPMCADPPEVDGRDRADGRAAPQRRDRRGRAPLDDAGVAIADLAVRRPTLDDVFIVLTGHAAEAEEDARRGAERRGAGERGRGGADVSALAMAVSDTMVLARRNLLRIPRAPDLLLSFTVQPIMFVLLFVYVFGGAISTPGYDYVDFLMPGIIVQTMAFGGFVTALGLAEDLKKGLIDRFRSLPIARSAVLAGRTLADVATNIISLAIMLAVGLLVGFSFDERRARDAGAGWGCCCSSATRSRGCSPTSVSPRRRPSRRRRSGFIAVFPLTFASSAFVPTDSMPSWLESFANANPITTVVDAIRALWLGAPAGTDVWMAVPLVARADRGVRDAVGGALPARGHAVAARLPPAPIRPGRLLRLGGAVCAVTCPSSSWRCRHGRRLGRGVRCELVAHTARN